jgi:glycosyltransferase involved in cell wall biosynthesis
MRLAAFTESPFFGGGEKALATLLGGLDEGIEATVVGPYPEIVEAVAAARPSASVRVVNEVANRRDARGIAGQFRAIRDLRPDILHANGNVWSGQYVLVAAALTRGVRTLHAHHSITPSDTRSQVWLNRRKLRQADCHTAVSMAVARGVEEVGRLPAGSVRVIYNGVADAPITPLARPVAGPLVGTVGRLSEEKGVDVLLRGLVELPDVTAVLVGDGPDRGALERLARELGIEDRVVFAGWHADPLPWVAAFDLFVLPSRLEALALAAIEAMLASRAVVASATGGVPEVVVDGETGLLVPSDDAAALAGAMRSLLADPARRERMGASGREVARRKFALEPMVRAYEGLYRELLAGRAS